MAKSIEIDRKKRLRDEPHKGHNRWHAARGRMDDRAPLIARIILRMTLDNVVALA